MATENILAFGPHRFPQPARHRHILFFSGAALSFAANPLSLTGLGMLKTWFVFPLAALWLWLETAPDDQDLEHALSAGSASRRFPPARASGFSFRERSPTTVGSRHGTLRRTLSPFSWLPAYCLRAYFLSSPFFTRRSFLRPLLWLSAAALVYALFLTRSYAAWASVFAAC